MVNCLNQNCRTAIKAESRSIVNLSRKFGEKENDARRIVWLRTTIYADKPQQKMLSLGFSDEVWVFVNGAITYIDKIISALHLKNVMAGALLKIQALNLRLRKVKMKYS